MATLGLNADDIAKRLSDGSLSMTDAYQLVINKLNEADDSTTQMQAGVGLLGTQFEDLGRESALAIDTTATSFDDLRGTMASIESANDTITKNFTAAWRTVAVELAKSGLFDGVRGGLNDFLKDFTTAFPEAMKGVDLSGLLQVIEKAKNQAAELFGAMFTELDLTEPEELTEVIQRVVDALATIGRVSTEMIAQFKPVVGLFGEAGANISEFGGESEQTFGKLAGYALLVKTLGKQFGLLAVVMNETGVSSKAVGDVIFGAGKIAAGALNTIFEGGKLVYESVSGVFNTLVKTIGESIKTLIDAAEIITPDALGGAKLRQWSDDLQVVIDDASQGMMDSATAAGESLDKIANNRTALEGVEQMQAGINRAFDDIANKAEENSGKVVESVENLPEAFGTIGGSADDASSGLDKLADSSAETAKQAGKSVQELEAMAQAGTELASVSDENQQALGEWQQKQKDLNLELAESRLKLAEMEAAGKDSGQEYESLKKSISGTEKALSSTSKVVAEMGKVQKAAKGEVVDLHGALSDLSNDDKIKVMEARVELDIANIEADAEKAVAAFESINAALEATGSGITSAFGALSGADAYERMDIFNIIERELDMQEQVMDRQAKLLDEQIKQAQERTKALERGDALITVNGEGLQPHLEAFMWEILDAIKIEADASGRDYLLGIGS